MNKKDIEVIGDILMMPLKIIVGLFLLILLLIALGGVVVLFLIGVYAFYLASFGSSTFSIGYNLLVGFLSVSLSLYIVGWILINPKRNKKQKIKE